MTVILDCLSLRLGILFMAKEILQRKTVLAPFRSLTFLIQENLFV